MTFQKYSSDEILIVLRHPRSGRHLSLVADIVKSTATESEGAKTIANHPDQISRLLSEENRRHVRLQTAKAVQKASTQTEIPESIRISADDIIAEEE